MKESWSRRLPAPTTRIQIVAFDYMTCELDVYLHGHLWGSVTCDFLRPQKDQLIVSEQSRKQKSTYSLLSRRKPADPWLAGLDNRCVTFPSTAGSEESLCEFSGSLRPRGTDGIPARGRDSHDSVAHFPIRPVPAQLALHLNTRWHITFLIRCMFWKRVWWFLDQSWRTQI